MSQGMSENEVKKKLYGEFAQLTKREEGGKPSSGIAKVKPIPRQGPISIKPQKKLFSIKSISILGLIVFIVLVSVFVQYRKSKPKVAALATGESEQIKGYLLQGKKYYNDKLFDEAMLIWKNILEIDPEHRAALRYIRRAELKKKELKIREEETAQKLKEMLARRERQEEERKRREEEDVRRQRINSEVQRLLKEGDKYFKQGEFSKAVAAYDEVLRLSPGNSHAVKNIARAEEKIVAGEKPQVLKKDEEPSPPLPPKGPLYIVQIATYTDTKYAQNLVNNLSIKGYKNVGIKKVSETSGRVWYCVYIGSFYNKDDAVREMEKIKKEGFKDSFVKIMK